MTNYVSCEICGQVHRADRVKFLNIEEDFYGRDVMYFECPVEKRDTSSLVYLSRVWAKPLNYRNLH